MMGFDSMYEASAAMVWIRIACTIVTKKPKP
jgi:hypothetical protein